MAFTIKMYSRRAASYALLILTGCLFSTAVFANCLINGGGPHAEVNFSPPTLIVNADAEPGTIIHTESQIAPYVALHCDGLGEIWQGYVTLSDAQKVVNSPHEGVYETGVPGIGFRAAWANNTNAALNAGNLLSPWHKGTATVEKGIDYPITLNATIQFVVTGPVSSGVIDSSKLNANWQYDDIIMGTLRFTNVAVNVQANSCRLVERNIVVPLKTITLDDFDNGYSPVVSDDSFRIALEDCPANMKVDYQFTSAGSTGVSGDRLTLSIASGSGAAEGVGIQILDSSGFAHLFDSPYTQVEQTTENQSITIPLKARYIQTGPLKGGSVDAVATFEIYYR
nr:fimbrial protein [uncultured Enterobacter sp.]